MTHDDTIQTTTARNLENRLVEDQDGPDRRDGHEMLQTVGVVGMARSGAAGAMRWPARLGSGLFWRLAVAVSVGLSSGLFGKWLVQRFVREVAGGFV